MMRSVITALVIALVATGWILSGQVGADDPPAAAADPATANSATAGPAAPATLARVRVRDSQAADKVSRLVLRGRTAADRRVVLRAQTWGEVATVHGDEGAPVAAGSVLIGLAEADRPARLTEARAAVDRRMIDHQAARKLSRKGFAASTRRAETLADLEAARAVLVTIELEIDHMTIDAPFDGMLHRRAVEVGDYVQEGDAVATIVDLDPILVVVQASERHVTRLRFGQPARARLLGGGTVDGVISYIAPEGDEATRTFRVDIAVPNPDGRIASNMTADVTLDLETLRAHRISPAVLTLDRDGRVGVKAVGADNRVVFHRVTILGDGPDGVWLGGLPETLRLITVGQGFVTAGQTVAPVPEAMVQEAIADQSRQLATRRKTAVSPARDVEKQR